MITFEHVVFKYDNQSTLNFNLHTHFAKNRVTGLIGPNGSGKTTLLHLILSLLKPNEGAVMLDNKQIFENPLLVDQIQYITSPYPYQRKKIKKVFNQYKREDHRFDINHAISLLKTFGLTPNMNMTTMSKGQVAVVYAIIGLSIKTQVTLFDEIELGMDDALRMKFYEHILLEQALDPRTIIISTNIFSETQTIFDDVKIMNHGQLVFEGKYQSILEDYRIIKYKETDEFLKTYSLKTITNNYWYKSLVKKEDIKSSAQYLIEIPTLEDVFEILTQKEVFNEKNKL